jgi:hypothetical protein
MAPRSSASLFLFSHCAHAAQRASERPRGGDNNKTKTRKPAAEDSFAVACIRITVVVRCSSTRERQTQRKRLSDKREREREKEKPGLPQDLSHDVWWQFVTEKEERENKHGGDVVLRRFLLFAIFSGISTFFFVEVLVCCAKFVASRYAKERSCFRRTCAEDTTDFEEPKKEDRTREREIRALEEIEQYAVVCWRLAAGVHVSSSSYLHRRSSSCSR